MTEFAGEFEAASNHNYMNQIYIFSKVCSTTVISVHGKRAVYVVSHRETLRHKNGLYQLRGSKLFFVDVGIDQQTVFFDQVTNTYL